MFEKGTVEGELTTYIVQGAKFQAPKRFIMMDLVGQGAYGIVCSAQDSVCNEAVAIKKIENTFEHLTFAKRTLRELKILRNLRHENLLEVREVFVPADKDTFEDIYIVSELMETDLASVIKSPQTLSNDHCQFFFYQLLRGLKYMHSAGVIHRDLKPRNLLVNSNCDLKICDYGLARVRYPKEVFYTCPMTEYVCTRWYRAPEVLCSWSDFGTPIDIWSVGCIFAEMLRRKPLFPGKNTQHQLQLIISHLGPPDPAVLLQIPNEKCRTFIQSLPTTAGTPLEEIVQTSERDAIDILTKMLCFGPDKRVNVERALEHPYLDRLHAPDDEPVRRILDCSEFEFERRKIDLKSLREEIYLEALRYNPQMREQYLRLKGKPYSITDYRLLHHGESHHSDDEDD